MRSNLQGLTQKGAFTRNFAIMLSGSALSTLIGILLTPITSRLYPPAAYGQFSIFNAIVSNLNLLTTLAYPGAFLLPKSRQEFLSLVKLTLLVSLVSCLLLAVGLGWAGPWLMHRLQAEGLGKWFYTIPIVLMVFNVNNVLGTWYVRDKLFARRVKVDIATTIGSRGFTITYGLLATANVTGLLLGDFISRVINTISLMMGGVRQEFVSMWRSGSWAQLKAVAREYWSFVLYNLPAGYVYVLSTQLPILVLAPIFGPTAVGLYSFSLGLLEMPINVLAGAIAPVFQQKAAETYHEAPERLPIITLNLYYKLLYISLLPFGIVTVYGDVLFKFVFGARWELAGLVTGYLGYYYVFKLLSLGTAGIYVILRKPQYSLYANLLLLVARTIGLTIGAIARDFNLILLCFGVASTIATFATDLHILSLLKLPYWRVALRTVVLVGITLALLTALRHGLALYFPLFSAPVGHL